MGYSFYRKYLLKTPAKIITSHTKQQNMEITLSPASLQQWSGTVLISGVLQETLEEQLADLEKITGGSLQKRLESSGFKAKSGEIKSFTGVSSPYEEPEKADLVIDTASEEVHESIEKLYNYIKKEFSFS